MRGRLLGLGACVQVLLAAGGARMALAAGVEHPDLGTVGLGRAGAFAANPYDGFALEYNPAGFADQRGFHFTLAASWSWQGLTFAPAGGAASVSNDAPPFLEPGGAVSYGFGPVGPLRGLTVAFGAVGPSAIGKESYDPAGPQRYALISTDFFIVYYSAAVAAKLTSWLSAGVTLQLVHGTARFSQAVYSGPVPGTAPAYDTIANVDVSNGAAPTGVFGVTVRPSARVVVGASYRPHFTFDANGSLTTVLPPAAMMNGVQKPDGTAAEFLLTLADVLRLGTEVTVTPRLVVEGDVVVERWNPLKTIEIHPQGITVTNTGIIPPLTKPLPNIVFPKDFETSVSVRVGGEYALIPARLTVRGGYLHETSAIPLSSTNVDFGNWDRDMVAVGASFTFPLQGVPLTVDVAYAHHFLSTRTVTSSTATQVVTPCLLPGCTDTQPTVVGNGTYSGALDVLALSLRLALDARWLAP